MRAIRRPESLFARPTFLNSSRFADERDGGREDYTRTGNCRQRGEFKDAGLPINHRTRPSPADTTSRRTGAVADAGSVSQAESRGGAVGSSVWSWRLRVAFG